MNPIYATWLPQDVSFGCIHYFLLNASPLRQCTLSYTSLLKLVAKLLDSDYITFTVMWTNLDCMALL